VEVLICSFILPESFTDTNLFRDIFWGRLEDILNRGNVPFRRLAHPTLRANLIPRIARERDSFVVGLLYATMGDIVRSAFALFRIDEVKSAPPVLGSDFRWLLRREQLRENGHPQFADTRLVYFTIRRVAALHASTLASVLFPFEGQRLEKMICIAFREQAPHVKLVGYVHAEPQPLMLSHGLGAGEIEFLPLPDRIATYGQQNLELLRRFGMPHEKTSCAGALRFEYLRSDVCHLRRASAQVVSERRVLVALPWSPPQAAALVSQLVEQFPDPFLDGPTRQSLRLTIKSHPTLPLKKIGWTRNSLPKWFEVSEQPLSHLLGTADVLVCVAPSTARWEAYFAGLPVISFQDDMLDNGDLAGAAADPILVASSATLRLRILEALATSESVAGRAQQRSALLDRMFSAVDEALWLDLARNSSAPLSGRA
jgi:hypothetical protein